MAMIIIEIFTQLISLIFKLKEKEKKAF